MDVGYPSIFWLLSTCFYVFRFLVTPELAADSITGRIRGLECDSHEHHFQQSPATGADGNSSWRGLGSQRTADANRLPQSAGRSIGIGNLQRLCVGCSYCRAALRTNRRCCSESVRLPGRGSHECCSHYRRTGRDDADCMDISKGEGQRHLAHHRCDDWLSGQCHHRRTEVSVARGGCQGLRSMGIGLVLTCLGRRDGAVRGADVHCCCRWPSCW